MKFEIVVLDRGSRIHRIEGRTDVVLSDREGQLLIEAESLLETITGYRYHINEVIEKK